MTLSRRDFLAFVIGGTAGGALATVSGLTYYYKKVQRRGGATKPASGSSQEGWMLSKEDLEALAKADRLVESEMLTILDNTDIPGSGDYKSMRVQSLGECVTACEQDNQCRAFTYARTTHELPQKRQMCWLKANTPEKINTERGTYVSGRR